MQTVHVQVLANNMAAALWRLLYAFLDSDPLYAITLWYGIHCQTHKHIKACDQQLSPALQTELKII